MPMPASTANASFSAMPSVSRIVRRIASPRPAHPVAGGPPIRRSAASLT